MVDLQFVVPRVGYQTYKESAYGRGSRTSYPDADYSGDAANFFRTYGTYGESINHSFLFPVFLSADNEYDFIARAYKVDSLRMFSGLKQAGQIDPSSLLHSTTDNYGYSSGGLQASEEIDVIAGWSPGETGWFTVEAVLTTTTMAEIALSFENTWMSFELVETFGSSNTAAMSLMRAANMLGTDGADSMTFSDDADFIFVGYGGDLVSAGGGDDMIYGNQENDTVYAGDGDDGIYLGQNEGPGSAHPGAWLGAAARGHGIRVWRSRK